MPGGNGNSTLAFIVGGLVVLVAGLVWYIYSGGDVGQDKAAITIELPDLGKK